MKNRKPHRVDIKTGASDDSNTEVISKDLAEDMKIITGIKGKNKNNKRSQPRAPRMF